MAIYDDTKPMEPVRIYDKGVKFENASEKDYRLNYRVGNMIAPAILSKEALGTMIDEFISSLRENRTPKTDGRAGRRVVQVLEAMSESMANGGQPVRIHSDLNYETQIGKKSA